MIRVLQVYPQMNNAGTERVILNLYKNIDRSVVQFDFLVEKPGEIDSLIKKMGGKIYYLYSDSKTLYYKELLKFFKNHPEYKIIHTHTHKRMNLVLKAAKKCNVKCRIAHSHNARNDLSKILWKIKGLSNYSIEKNATDFFACSENAARWLFSHKYKQCNILLNGINLEDYCFDKSKREKIRQDLNINADDFVMVHVGRFAKQKNHEFLVKILEQFNKKNKKWKMIFVGIGPLQDEIIEKIDNLGLSDHVSFLGNRNDVNDILSCSDSFVFPSLHEGLGIVVIEAQANGLPCIVSDAVPKEADLHLGLLHTLSLSDSVDYWVECISRYCNENRLLTQDQINNNCYNIKTIAKSMQNFYCLKWEE